MDFELTDEQKAIQSLCREFAREEVRPRVQQAADHHGQAGVHVRLLGGHEAEVLDPRQAHVLDDEVQVREVGRGVVDVGYVERVLVQRPDRRALVHVDVLDAPLLGLLQEPAELFTGHLCDCILAQVRWQFVDKNGRRIKRPLQTLGTQLFDQPVKTQDVVIAEHLEQCTRECARPSRRDERRREVVQVSRRPTVAEGASLIQNIQLQAPSRTTRRSDLRGDSKRVVRALMVRKLHIRAASREELSGHLTQAAGTAHHQSALTGKLIPADDRLQRA